MKRGIARRGSIRGCPPRMGIFATIVTVLLVGYAPGTPADPMIPKIAYSSFQGSGSPQIWIMNPDGTTPKKLTSHPAGGDGAAISPDGTQIVFESPRYGWANLFLIQTDGTGEHRLLDSNFYGQSATWSPDGTLLAFTHSSTNGSPGGVGSTWVVGRVGTGLTQLSPPSADDWLPSWSPDGERIAFQSIVAGVWQIFLMNANGSDRQQLTTGPEDKYGPRWSPDGLRLAYSLVPDPDVVAASIHIARVDGTSDYALTDTTGFNGRPCWSPDGSAIAFHSNRYGNFRIFRINIDRTDFRQLTTGAAAPGDLAGDWHMVAVPPAGTLDPQEDLPFRIDLQNPARAGSVIRFSTEQEVAADLAIYDSGGRRLRHLLNDLLPPGRHEAVWDGRDDSGWAVPSGLYYVRLAGSGASQTRKLVLLR